MTTDSFKESNLKGNKGVKLLADYLDNKNTPYELHNLDGQHLGDISVNGKTIEIKTDFYESGNMAIETISNKQYGTVGWLYKLKSDFFMYIDYPNKIAYYCKTKKFASWMKRNLCKFEERSVGYSDSIIKLVPYTDFIEAMHPKVIKF